MSTNQNERTTDVSVNTVPKQLMRHYQAIAYALALTTYAFSFGEYLFLRLTYLLNPENIIQHSSCANDSSGYQMVVGKGAINYAVTIAAFISVATFQFMCFFGLTVSEKWIKYRSNTNNDRISKLRVLLSQRIRNTMEATLYPTFACYALASASVWLIIFYMVGVRDSIDKLASTISLYIFDAIILLYFFVFPMITYIYHPYVRKSSTQATLHASGAQNASYVDYTSNQQIPLPTTSCSISRCNEEVLTANEFPSWLCPPRIAGCNNRKQSFERHFEGRTAISHNQISYSTTIHPKAIASTCDGRIITTV